MKTKVITAEEAFEVRYSDFNGTNYEKVQWKQLRNDPIGTIYSASTGLCGRDVSDETAKIVYRDKDGVAVLFQCYRTSDDPDPQAWEEEPVLTWFQFH